MVKNSKRKQDIKSKLLAAIAMLMVATIMMVSSTYAWFTLSTAPEVQGISTNVGSNGNLEIALSPSTGDAADVEDGNTNDDWIVKNLTWGNQLKLSGLYDLEGINLYPAQLNSNDLASTPLSTPVYGADGRIDKLEANTLIGGKIAGKTGWVVPGEDEKAFGVRVVGTSSTMTEYQTTFNQQYSNLGIAYKGVQNKAQAGLNANGSALAEMAIKHANAENGDPTNDYSSYVGDLTALIASLTEANNDLEQAIRASISAIGSSNLLQWDPEMVATPGSPTEEEAEDLAAIYNAIQNLVANNPLDVIWDDATLQNALAAIEKAYTLNLGQAYDVWEANTTTLKNASDALAAIDTNTTVLWTAVSPVVGVLMEINDNLKINGYKLSEFKDKAMAALDEPQRGDYAEDDAGQAEYDAAYAEYEKAVDFVSSIANDGISLEMGSGTGIYADLAGLVGNIHATVEDVSVTIPFGGKNVTMKLDASMDTTTGNNPVFVGVRSTLSQIGYLKIDSSADRVIDNAYGYIVDFMFRTNASGSKLLLQTEPKDRVYGENGSNEDLMGGGSTMTFTSDALSEQSVKNLMKALRVVFFDTVTGEQMGIAKLDETSFTSADAEGGKKEITGELYLYALTDEGAMTDTQLAGNDAILCDLPTNTAKAVSALVYLSGANITNADVAATAQSMTGTMNLQFASDATLTPMENSALMNGEGTTEQTTTEGQP